MEAEMKELALLTLQEVLRNEQLEETMAIHGPLNT
jgi:hypothetical protein